MKKQYIMDGNEACATAAYLFSEVCGIYPITPSSPMATLCDKWSTQGRKNLFNEKVKVIQMQSEGGAAGLIHGSLQAGSLTTTFTASQGLLLMIPSMYKIAGEMLPGVIHVAARSLATHALSIFGDHQDIYACRSTGFAILSSSSVQDAYNLAIVAHLSALKGKIPFIHFFDGFRTSHELNKISILDEKNVLGLIDYDIVNDFKNRAINIGKNITRGTSQTEDIYFQNTEARNKYYMDLPDIVNEYMMKVNSLTGENYKPFTYYGSKDAKKVIVAMGSVTDTIKALIDELDDEVGLINVHLYRPFSVKYFLEALPKTVEKIAVLDRTKEAGSLGEPLYLDIASALKDERIAVIGGRYGLSSKDVTPADIKAVFDNLDKHKPISPFTIGIEDDVTELSLTSTPYELKNKYQEIKVFGFGSDGMVSGSKNVMKVVGEEENKYVQGYFEYDSKKSGGVTIGHLRISDKPIRAPYYPTLPSIVVVTKDSYMHKYDILSAIKHRGVFLLCTSKTDEELNEFLPTSVKEIIKNKEIKFLISNTFDLDTKFHLNGKINNVVSNYLLKMLGCSDNEVNRFKELVKKTFGDKGQEIVDNNLNAMDESFEYLREYNYELFTYEEDNKDTDTSLTEEMLKRRGSKLKVSDFIGHEDGTFEGGTSASDKRKVTEMTPKWIKENCIECNQCSFVCPHAVIRPYAMTEEEFKQTGLKELDTIDCMGEQDKKFYIAVNESNCTGCGLCVNVCPGKNGEKALKFDEYNDDLDIMADKVASIVKNKTVFNKYTVKGIGFEKPVFEFSGACAGCGETSYIRTLTDLFGKEIVIANATGCSSIYGASLPCTPYKIPWINSLFEDNAEFGLGLHSSYKNNRDRIEHIMFESRNIVTPDIKDIYKKWIDNREDYEITSSVRNELINKEIPQELKDLTDYIPSRKVWIIGGDGWAYDIGYGGLDHVLASNEDVKILVLDTEVYSNTGGQKSKSTRISAVAEFASNGKNTFKKDLFKIAMNIPNVYVASICLGANMPQTIKAFKEAHEHKGPSLIIAYSPCIEHGISGGMRNSLDEEKLLVESGYNILMRYNPEKDELSIDSSEPDFTKYEEIFKRELRYKNLANINKDDYKELYESNIDYAKKRYNYFKDLKNKSV